MAKATIDLIANDSRFQRTMRGAIARCQSLRTAMMGVANASKWMLMGATAALGFAVKAAGQQADAERMLSNALARAGKNAAELTRRYGKAATEIQKLTTVGDEAVLGLMKQALTLGANADKLDETARAAIGLSRALGMDLDGALRATILATAGNFTMLQRYIPALRETDSAAAKLAAVQKLANEGWAQAQDETKGLGGRMLQLKNAVGDLAEEIGKPLLDSMTAAVQRMKEWAEAIAPVVANHGEATKAVTGTALTTLALVAIMPRAILTVGALAKVGKVTGAALSGLKAALGALAGLSGAQIGVAAANGLTKLGLAAGAAKAALLAVVANPVVLAVGVLATAVAAVAVAWRESTKWAEEYKRVQQGSLDDAAEWADVRTARNAVGSARTPDERGQAQADLVEALKRRVASMKSEAERLEGTSWWEGHELSDPVEWEQARTLRAQQARMEESLRGEMDKLAGMKAARTGTAAAGGAADEGPDVEKRLRALDMELVAVGATKRETELLKALSEGWSESELKILDAKLAQLEAAEAQVDAQKRQNDLHEQATGRVAELSRELALLSGWTEEQIKLFDLQNLGMAKEDIAIIAELLNQTKAAKAEQAAKDEAAAVKKRNLTKEEVAAEERANAERLFKAGKLSGQDYAREQKRIDESLAAKEAGRSTAGAWEGLVEHSKRIQSAAMGTGSPEEKMAAAAEATAEAGKETVTKVGKVEAALEKIHLLLLDVKHGLPLVGAFGR
ncbi:MAG: hypothetical protein AB1716_05600 [Planctomycetota bacterium]